jgi:hypothetical protein
VGGSRTSGVKNRRRLGRHAAVLRVSDLNEPATAGMPRVFDARLVRIEPRITSLGLPWGVLTFEWLSDHELRCPLFPTQWATTPKLVTGRTYRVVGTVSFRDRTPAIRVLTIRESTGRHAWRRLRGACRRRSSVRPARRWRHYCDVSRAESPPREQGET